VPVYWFFFRNLASLNIKDFLLAILMVFLLSAHTGRDFAAVSSYCIWIMLASLFPASGPNHWILLGILFTWFLCVQCLNELRRNREQMTDWKGPDGWALLRPLFGFAALLLTGIGAFAGTLYVLLPRAPIAAFHLDFKPLRRIIGFSGAVRLGEIGQIQDDRTPAFRVRFIDGTPPPVMRWRGIALVDFNGTSWSNSMDAWSEFSQQGKIVVASDEQRRRPGQRLFYEVQSLAAMDRTLFTTGIPEYFFLPQGRLRRSIEGGYRQLSLEERLPTYSYSGFLDPSPHPLVSESPLNLFQPARQRYLRLTNVHPAIIDLARKVSGGDNDPYRAASRIEQHLKTQYAYSLQSNISSADPLLDFLFQTRAGHCEYFASAMAVMLRALKIPTRVVTGFYASLPEPIGSWYVIRSTNAHSWVEVFIDGKGWMVFDPTPNATTSASLSPTAMWLLRIQDRLVVMSEEWLGGHGGFKRPTFSTPEIDATWLLPIAIVPALWLLWRRRATPLPVTHEATILYEQYLAILKRHRAPGQTARELDAGEITLAYERARFAEDPAALERLRELIRRLISQA
jgi:transglutaminase-like putative cysteine protease